MEKTELPPPEVDITKTAHVRTFAPGSGGPHLDVLLHNQLTIIRQNQEIRLMLQHYLAGQRGAPGFGLKSEKITALFVSESLRTAILEASRTFVRDGGKLQRTRSKKLKMAMDLWIHEVRRDEILSAEQVEEFDKLELAQMEAFFLWCGDKVLKEQQSSHDGRQQSGMGDVEEDDIEEGNIEGDIEGDAEGDVDGSDVEDADPMTTRGIGRMRTRREIHYYDRPRRQVVSDDDEDIVGEGAVARQDNAGGERSPTPLVHAKELHTFDESGSEYNSSSEKTGIFKRRKFCRGVRDK